MAVGEIAHHGLEQRRGELIDERDGSYLEETQPQGFFQRWIDGGDDRLEHVVEQVAKADHQQYRHDCLALSYCHPT